MVFKKGDQTKYANYRGITLLNVAYKIFAALLYNQLAPYYEKAIGEYQCGFIKKKKSTMDQIFVLREINENV